MNVNSNRRSTRRRKAPNRFINEQANLRKAELELARHKKKQREAKKNVTMADQNVKKAKRLLNAAKRRKTVKKTTVRNPNRNRSPHPGNYYAGIHRERSYDNPRRRVSNKNVYRQNMGVMRLTPNQQRQLNMYASGFTRSLTGNVFAAGPSRQDSSSILNELGLELNKIRLRN